MLRNRILVVGNADVESLLNTDIRFSSAGYDSFGVADLGEALTLARLLPPALTIINHNPPELDGFQVALELKKLSLSGTLVMAAEKIDTSLTLRCMRSGFSDCLRVPVDASALADSLERLITQQTTVDTSQDTIEKLLDQAKEPILMSDEDGEIVLCNKAACILFSEQPTAKNPARPTLDSIIYPEVGQLMMKSVTPDTPLRTELTLQDGSLTLSAQLTIVPGLGRIVVMQDITYLKNMDRVKGEFVERVSRDIRSPLTTILGYVELIERMGPINEDQRRFIERITFSVRSITALLSDLLELSRIEADFDADREPTQLPMIIRYALEGNRKQIEDKNLALSVSMPERAPLIVGNPLRLRQMIVNLLENAIKFTPEDGTIGVVLEQQDDLLVVQISDSGIGIPTSEQAHIFNRFFRATNVVELYKGTGLGLSIVKSIVDKHNGRIWVESNEGAGSTFFVMLPTQDDHSENNSQ